MEARGEPDPAPASFNLFAIPDQAERRNDYAIHIPDVMGIIGTRSLTQTLPGINELAYQAQGRVRGVGDPLEVMVVVCAPELVGTYKTQLKTSVFLSAFYVLQP